MQLHIHILIELDDCCVQGTNVCIHILLSCIMLLLRLRDEVRGVVLHALLHLRILGHEFSIMFFSVVQFCTDITCSSASKVLTSCVRPPPRPFTSLCVCFLVCLPGGYAIIIIIGRSFAAVHIVLTPFALPVRTLGNCHVSPTMSLPPPSDQRRTRNFRPPIPAVIPRAGEAPVGP